MLYLEMQEVHATTCLPYHWHSWLQNQHGVMVSLVGRPSSQSLYTGKELQRQQREARLHPFEVAAKDREERRGWSIVQDLTTAMASFIHQSAKLVSPVQAAGKLISRLTSCILRKIYCRICGIDKGGVASSIGGLHHR